MGFSVGGYHGRFRKKHTPYPLLSPRVIQTVRP
jgi:hypothetical protein